MKPGASRERGAARRATARKLATSRTKGGESVVYCGVWVVVLKSAYVIK